MLAADESGTPQPVVFARHLGELSAVDLVFGPHQSTAALYYITFAEGGQVRRIAHTPNASPTARASAAPAFGPLPLTVTLDASASSDPEGDLLTYAWAFGDGTPGQAGAVAVHTYTSAGAYDARVTVRDSHGNVSVAKVRVDAGNTPPTPFIVSPAASSGFAVGEAITLSGLAFDAEDWVLPAGRLSWTVLLHHNTHTHPFLPPTSGNDVTFVAPAPEDLQAAGNSHLEIVLTATDSGGARASQHMVLRPRLVEVTLASEPPGLALTVNDSVVTTPAIVTSWENYRLTISAATQADTDQHPWLFGAWTDGAPAERTVAPVSDTTYTAVFQRATYVVALADTFVRDGAYADDSYGGAGVLVANTSWIADERFETFVQFDVGAAGHVERAVLRLFGAMTDARSQNVPVRAFGVPGAWDEGSLTWATRPTAEPDVAGAAVIVDEIPRWQELDVTEYVRQQRQLGVTTAGFVLRIPVLTKTRAAFAARDSGLAAPHLLLVVPSAAPASSPDPARP